MISKNNITIAQIKEEIEKLKGKRINMSVNQGRKRYTNFEGIIQDTYNSIFIVRLTNNENTIKKFDALKGETPTDNKQKTQNSEECSQDNVSIQDANLHTNICTTTTPEKGNKENFNSLQNKQINNTKTSNANVVDIRTYSYIDILCGNVDIDGFMQKIK